MWNEHIVRQDCEACERARNLRKNGKTKKKQKMLFKEINWLEIDRKPMKRRRR